jgi:Holliday junction resolvase RusA-like endonuclease
MKTQQLKILNWTPDLNTYILKERGNRYAAANYKKEWTEVAKMEALAQKLKPIKGKVNIDFFWYMADRRRDKDNISFTRKFIMDGLVWAGVLENDGWDDIGNFKDIFQLGTKAQKPFVNVFLEEI